MTWQGRTTIAAAIVIGATVAATAKQAAATKQAPAATQAAAGVQRAPFGKLADGSAVEIFTLTNAAKMEVRVINYGAIIVSIRVPDRAGQFADVVLGHDNLEGYVTRSRFSARSPGGTPIGSRARASASTARNTSWSPTTGRIRCTAARRASTRWCGRRRWPSRRRPGPA